MIFVRICIDLIMVAALRCIHPPARVLPAIYGCRGLVNVETVDLALSA
jgi:hypothetical protein